MTVVHQCDRFRSARRSIIDKGGACPARAQWDLFIQERVRIDHLVLLKFIVTQHLNVFCCPVKELRLPYAPQELSPADRPYAFSKQRRRADYEVA